MSDEPTCKTCPWWSPERYPSPPGTDPLNGQCRIAPPPWPKAHRDDWCGEHPDRVLK